MNPTFPLPLIDAHRQLAEDGYALLPAVFTAEEVAETRRALVLAMAESEAGSLRSREGTVFAARNVIDWFPQVRRLWQREPVLRLLRELLGDRLGLVRVLFFDKPPERSWSLPWHQDLTIAVERNDLPSACFTNPTHKAGVAHVEAPEELLRRMLTLRIHLDEVTAENGPLQVLPGSHLHGKHGPPVARPAEPILAAAGDVLAIRPLVSHSSGNALPGVARHRRILHLEFAADETLPDGYRWRHFQPLKERP